MGCAPDAASFHPRACKLMPGPTNARPEAFKKEARVGHARSREMREVDVRREERLEHQNQRRPVAKNDHHQ